MLGKASVEAQHEGRHFQHTAVIARQTSFGKRANFAPEVVTASWSALREDEIQSLMARRGLASI